MHGCFKLLVYKLFRVACMYNMYILYTGYNRGQSSSVSPRGYGSTGSTPHSNGSAYSTTMNGYHSSAGGLGNMGMFERFDTHIAGTKRITLCTSLISDRGFKAIFANSVIQYIFHFYIWVNLSTWGNKN